MARPFFRKIKKQRLRKKVARLKDELQKRKELIKRLQKSCFIDKKITPKTYKNRAGKYEERIAEINHTLPVLVAELVGKKVVLPKRKGVLVVKK